MAAVNLGEKAFTRIWENPRAAAWLKRIIAGEQTSGWFIFAYLAWLLAVLIISCYLAFTFEFIAYYQPFNDTWVVAAFRWYIGVLWIALLYPFFHLAAFFAHKNQHKKNVREIVRTIDGYLDQIQDSIEYDQVPSDRDCIRIKVPLPETLRRTRLEIYLKRIDHDFIEASARVNTHHMIMPLVESYGLKYKNGDLSFQCHRSNLTKNLTNLVIVIIGVEVLESVTPLL